MSEGDGVSLIGMIIGEAFMRREHLSGDLNKVLFYKKKKRKKERKNALYTMRDYEPNAGPLVLPIYCTQG